MKMTSTLREEILTETYGDMQKLIFGIVWKFWRIYGGDLDDLTGQANLIFITAFDSYDPSKSKLTTWLTTKIKWGLLDYMKEGNVYESHVSIDDEFVEIYPVVKEDISVIELLDEMDQDAHTILQLFLDIPRDIMVNILNEHCRVKDVQANLRNRLLHRLRQMGWNLKRIRKTFEEIKNVTS